MYATVTFPVIRNVLKGVKSGYKLRRLCLYACTN